MYVYVRMVIYQRYILYTYICTWAEPKRVVGVAIFKKATTTKKEKGKKEERNFYI